MMGIAQSERIRAPRKSSAPNTLWSRSALARERADAAREALRNCRLCAHECGVDRRGGETGLCRAGTKARVFSAQVEVSDELELIPTFAIALSGCDLRCDFCITGGSSWNPRAGEALDPTALAARATQALESGARTVMILGGEPTVHLAAALDIVAAMPDSARLVWKTNAHGSTEARALLDGIFDVWVADFKFGNDDCALRLARIQDYTRVVRENLVWANERSDLIVRHLVMPGHLDCCWRRVAEWLAHNLPGAKVNLRPGFWPAWRSARHTGLRRTVSRLEAEAAFAIAQEHRLNLVS